MTDNAASKSHRYRIHPGVGIARLGNSITDYFIGPEAPGWRPPPTGGYKDAAGKIKRQGARFRIYEYDGAGKPSREVTAFSGTRITWTVHLANKKGSWYKFVGRYGWADEANHGLRNASAGESEDPDARAALIIDPGPVTIEGVDKSQRLPDAPFLGTPVGLGELRTDDHGRLVVLGGAGRSVADKLENLITHFANNDGWCDDTADGIVQAQITLDDGTQIDADPAWVIVAPPKYVPTLDNLVTLDDTVRELYIAQKWLLDPLVEVDFDRDIAPLLDRVCGYAWVSAAAYRGHSVGAGGDFKSDENRKKLRDNSAASADYRQHVLGVLRVPLAIADDETAQRQACRDYMPPLSGDGGGARWGDPATWMSVLPSQYERLKRWADGDFVVTAPKEAVPLDQIEVADQPEALDRAAMQSCVGGPFFPGIEMTWICQEPKTWRDAYRVAADFKPGDITRWMALPWQADFYQCMFHWWPVQRPDEVLAVDLLEAVSESLVGKPASGNGRPPSVSELTPHRVPWVRGLPATSPEGENALVKYWSDLGFVQPLTLPSGETVVAERDRAKYAGVNTRDLFYALMNIDSHLDVLPAARAFVEQCLAEARRYQAAPDTPFSFTPLLYSPHSFANRLESWYREMVAANDRYNPAGEATLRSRSILIERLRQFGPYNMTDGSWLRGIGNVGPMDVPHALAFSVLMDEYGDGDVRQNHPNIYRALLNSLHIYPADCASREFVYDESLLDSAFDVPCFQMAISQFSQHFFPEILGMTVYLEFSIIEVKKTIALMRYHHIDPHYYVLHVGIDNPEDGHSARAMKAVNVYLEEYASSPDLMQSLWRRIWDGFVAFHMTGTFGRDFQNYIDPARRPTLEDRVAKMIAAKAQYGQLNHGGHKLAGTYINAWFSDPYGFMKALVKDGWFIPGDPDNSRFFELTSFETGPMFRVFSESELKLWADWCRELANPPIPPSARNIYSRMVAAMGPIRQLVNDIPIRLFDPDDPQRSHRLDYWAQQPAPDVLRVLGSPVNELVEFGKPEDSPLLTEILAASSAAGRALREHPILGTDISAFDATYDWVKFGHPVSRITDPIPALWLTATAEQVDSHPTGEIVGMGAIH